MGDLPSPQPPVIDPSGRLFVSGQDATRPLVAAFANDGHALAGWPCVVPEGLRFGPVSDPADPGRRPGPPLPWSRPEGLFQALQPHPEDAERGVAAEVPVRRPRRDADARDRAGRGLDQGVVRPLSLRPSTSRRQPAGPSPHTLPRGPPVMSSGSVRACIRPAMCRLLFRLRNHASRATVSARRTGAGVDSPARGAGEVAAGSGGRVSGAAKPHHAAPHERFRAWR